MHDSTNGVSCRLSDKQNLALHESSCNQGTTGTKFITPKLVGASKPTTVLTKRNEIPIANSSHLKIASLQASHLKIASLQASPFPFYLDFMALKTLKRCFQNATHCGSIFDPSILQNCHGRDFTNQTAFDFDVLYLSLRLRYRQPMAKLCTTITGLYTAAAAPWLGRSSGGLGAVLRARPDERRGADRLADEGRAERAAPPLAGRPPAPLPRRPALPPASLPEPLLPARRPTGPQLQLRVGRPLNDRTVPGRATAVDGRAAGLQLLLFIL